MRSAAAVAVLVVAAALVVLPAGSASAHDYLVSSSPTADSTVTAPLAEVSLTFNDVVLDLSRDSSSAILEVTGPDAQTTHFETGCASILSRTVSAPVALGGAGTYVVSWQVVSSDGHPVSDSLSFTYAPTAGAVAATGSASAPDCGRSAGVADTGALPAGATSADDGAAGWIILGVAGGIVVVALLAVAVIVVVSGRRKVPENFLRKEQSGS